MLEHVLSLSREFYELHKHDDESPKAYARFY